jgi:DNA-binding transcriptional MerR regulator
MKLSVSETSKLMGVSVRTLHYYDEIGLLTPSKKTEAGYRFYDEKNLSVLQQILFYRELELPLMEIVHILSQPDHDQKTALINHRELLLQKQMHMTDLLRLVDETLGGNESMKNDKFTFTDVEEAKSKYAAEAEARWGKTEAYKESKRREAHRTHDETLEMMTESNDIFAAFAKSMDLAPSDPKVQALVKLWQDFITKHHYKCTNEILEGLGEMYISDERFTESIDRFGDGTARFMYEAIKAYCATK